MGLYGVGLILPFPSLVSLGLLTLINISLIILFSSLFLALSFILAIINSYSVRDILSKGIR